MELVLAVVLLVGPGWLESGQITSLTAQDNAIAAIEKLGGGVRIDQNGGVWVRFYESSLPDQVLQHITDIKNLQGLDLRATKVTDAGLAGLIKAFELRELCLAETSVSGMGLIHLSKLRKLQILDLCSTEVDE
jgi:hypothetical protein